ncbi:MAG: caspase family protein [Bacteroidales bacterium]|nr:caspase family protein [Bacteroidales bacterium]
MRNLVLFFLLALSVLSVSGRTIYVLSVGICDYKYTRDLLKAENDAKSFAELYLTHTQNVTTLLGAQATRENILNALRSCFSKAEEEDIVVFFFSGHGDRGGLCAYDTKGPTTLVAYAEVQKAIGSCRAANKQLFIDACYAGGLRGSKQNRQPTSSLRPPLSDTQGIMLFLSSRTGETSQENRWADNGFFTQYLIKGLKGAADTDCDRIITAKEIFTYVSTKVSERTRKKQNPVMWGKFNDNMHIINWNPKRNMI